MGAALAAYGDVRARRGGPSRLDRVLTCRQRGGALEDPSGMSELHRNRVGRSTALAGALAIRSKAVSPRVLASLSQRQSRNKSCTTRRRRGYSCDARFCSCVIVPPHRHRERLSKNAVRSAKETCTCAFCKRMRPRSASTSRVDTHDKLPAYSRWQLWRRDLDRCHL
jgi:hypothetical protein